MFKFVDHGIHCLPCSGTNDMIYVLPYNQDFIFSQREKSVCQGSKEAI